MLRFLCKSLVVIMLALGIGNYVIYLKTGNLPLVAWKEKLGGDWFTDLKESVSPDQLADKAKKMATDIAPDSLTETKPRKVYKWTDENGVVHYGERAVTRDAQELTIDPDTNVLSSGTPAQTEAATTAITEPQSPLEKARAAAEAMKARTRQQQESTY